LAHLKAFINILGYIFPLFVNSSTGGHYSEVDCENLVHILAGWGLGSSLLTGGVFSEVAVNTGLTVIA
jgi:hypothetical protein